MNEHIYKMFHAEIKMGKKLFTAQKRGETRAIFLGLGMILSSVMTYYIMGITILPSRINSVLTESECTLLQVSVEDIESWSLDCGQVSSKTLQYPCLQVFVKLPSSEQKVFLYHTEDTPEINAKCSYLPVCSENYTELHAIVNDIANRFRRHHQFPCYHDQERKPKSVFLKKERTLTRRFDFLFWPTFMLIGGICIIIMVKISHYFSVLAAQKS